MASDNTMPHSAVHIGDIIGHGIIFDPRNREMPSSTDFDELRASIPRLFDLLDEQGNPCSWVGLPCGFMSQAVTRKPSI